MFNIHASIESTRIKAQKIRSYLPALAFFAGFTWDSVTMGRMVKTVDLVILMAYYLGACSVMILQARDVKPEWQKWLTLILQFFFGGLFSALVVFYFKSSGSILTAFFVGILGIMLVANEFLGSRYEQQGLSWTIFTLCSVMFLNFLLPHLVHSVQPIWFYTSCLVSFAVVYIVRLVGIAEKRQITLPTGKSISVRSDLKLMLLPGTIIGALIILYQQQIIPPVPLVLKANHICVELKKDATSYQCQEEDQPLYRFFGIGRYTLHFEPDQKIYNLSSVYGPNQIKVELEQRWYQQNPVTKKWQPRGIIPVAMVGGRINGWRIYSYIHKTVQAGRWRVETAVRGGAILARKTFILKEKEKTETNHNTVRVE